jgi:hypothetical protein
LNITHLRQKKSLMRRVGNRLPMLSAVTPGHTGAPLTIAFAHFKRFGHREAFLQKSPSAFIWIASFLAMTRRRFVIARV